LEDEVKLSFSNSIAVSFEMISYSFPTSEISYLIVMFHMGVIEKGVVYELNLVSLKRGRTGFGWVSSGEYCPGPGKSLFNEWSIRSALLAANG